jgi:hypothetical protein
MSQSRIYISLGVLLAAGLSVASASALTVDGIQMDPVYFNSGGNLGLIPGPPVNFVVKPTDDWLLAGSGDPLSIKQNLQTPVLQNPQFPASSQNLNGPQGTPNKTNPFVADSIWTITNNTNAPINHAYLVFESVDLGPTALLPGGYPNIPIGVDRDLFSIVQYTYQSSPGKETTLFFGAVSLGSLGAHGSQDDSTQIRVRYFIAGALPANGNNLVMPPFSVAGLANVPEPGTFLLVGGGVMLLAAGRRRCA